MESPYLFIKSHCFLTPNTPLFHSHSNSVLSPMLVALFEDQLLPHHILCLLLICQFTIIHWLMWCYSNDAIQTSHGHGTSKNGKNTVTIGCSFGQESPATVPVPPLALLVRQVWCVMAGQCILFSKKFWRWLASACCSVKSWKREVRRIWCMFGVGSSSSFSFVIVEDWRVMIKIWLRRWLHRDIWVVMRSSHRLRDAMIIIESV